MTTATRRPATIEVLDIIALNKGNLKATATVRLGPSITVHKCRVLQPPGRRAWVSMPQERWEDADGQPHYTPLVELAAPLRARVEQAVLQAARRQGLIVT